MPKIRSEEPKANRMRLRSIRGMNSGLNIGIGPHSIDVLLFEA